MDPNEMMASGHSCHNLAWLAPYNVYSSLKQSHKGTKHKSIYKIESLVSYMSDNFSIFWFWLFIKFSLTFFFQLGKLIGWLKYLSRLHWCPPFTCPCLRRELFHKCSVYLGVIYRPKVLGAFLTLMIEHKPITEKSKSHVTIHTLISSSHPRLTYQRKKQIPFYQHQHSIMIGGSSLNEQKVPRSWGNLNPKVRELYPPSWVTPEGCYCIKARPTWVVILVEISGLVEVHCMAEVMALDILCLLHIFHWNAMYLIPHVLGLFCPGGGQCVEGKNSQCDVHIHIIGGIEHSDLPWSLSL